MEKDVILKIRLSAEMKEAITKHSREFYRLPVAQVIRALIANELAEEGITLKQQWSATKPKSVKVVFTTQGVKADNAQDLGKLQGAKNGR